MAQMDVELLSSVVDEYVADRAVRVSPAERSEMIRIAQADPCKRSASAAGVAYETTRARRKRIYRKCGVTGAAELTSALLRVSLVRLRREGLLPAADVRRAAAATGSAGDGVPRLLH